MAGRSPKTDVDLGDERRGDPGGGPIDPVTGIREWYDPEPQDSGITWEDLLTRWALIEADLHQTYGVDLGEPGLLRARTGAWLRVRVLGLLTEPKSRIFRVLRAEREPDVSTPADQAEFDD
ncbi:hypothetical protein [Streptosporangium sp. NPDC049376]|uniref:hypothetical protein n=1 Tax=Streptosporangium sp. NPDC049376 TaxID=3366192 RepID=UPI0037A8747C